MWKFFLKNSKFTLLLASGAMLFGLASAISLPRESQPEVNIPIGVVVTPFPGASVEEVETLVTDKIEDKLNSLEDVEKITSDSRRGISSITIQFDADEDTDEKIDELKDIIDQVKIELPNEAEDPIVNKVSLNDTPFLTLTMSGPFALEQIKAYADDLKSEIETVGGVSTVQVFGGRDRELQVVVDKSKLDTFGIPLGSVVRAIQTANSDIPIGSIITGEEEYALRFDGRLKSRNDLLNVPVGAVNGIPVFVGDIASVNDSFSEAQKLVRLSNGVDASNPAVSIRVFKSAGGDVTRIADKILQLSEKAASEEFPEAISIEATENLAKYIRQDLGSLTRNGIATVIIVAILLALFLGKRESLMSVVAIPLSFLITFIILSYSGYTLNFMTLFSLILSLGILVDSTIVMNESLNKNMQSGLEPIKAAMKSIKELQYPLITGTLTTIFAFVPMLLTGGMMGEFIKSIPITVTVVLVASLFVALAIITTLTVVLAERAKKKNIESLSTKKPTKFSKYFEHAREEYEKILKALFSSKEKRKKLKKYLVVLFIATYFLPFGGILGIELFPPADQDAFGIDLQLPFGTPLENTEKAMHELEAEILGDPRVNNLVTYVGFSGSLGSQSGGGEGTHLGYILVNLKEKGRKEKSFEIVDEYQTKLQSFELGDVSVTQPGYGPGAAAPVEVTITGEELDTLDALARDIKSKLAEVKGTQNVNSSVVQTNGQFVVKVDRARAAQYGITASDIAFTLRTAINGAEATSITLDGDDVDVIVRYGLSLGAFDPEASVLRKTDIETIKSLTISTPVADIPLLSVADINLENSRASVRHEDGDRVVKVNSYLSSGVSPAAVFGAVNEMISKYEFPEGYTARLGGEDEETQESLQDMFRAMILAAILIAALMVLQFGSFRHAFIIMTTIPMALIGVFPGLLLVGQPLSFPGMIGIVALAGIVVNNAIILIDKININKREGMELDDALIEAGKSRLEPIVLTMITTVFGILPLALTEPLWSSLGYAIIFGLMFSTVLTLVVIPLLYRRGEMKMIKKEAEVK